MGHNKKKRMNVNGFVSRIDHHVSRKFRHIVILITVVFKPRSLGGLYGNSRANKLQKIPLPLTPTTKCLMCTIQFFKKQLLLEKHCCHGFYERGRGEAKMSSLENLNPVP
jgi:hypothetical protein